MAWDPDLGGVVEDQSVSWPRHGTLGRYFMASGLIGLLVTACVVGYGDLGKVSREMDDWEGLSWGSARERIDPEGQALQQAGMLRMDRCRTLTVGSAEFEALRCKLLGFREGKSPMDHTRWILQYGPRTPGLPGWQLTLAHITSTMRGLGWTVEEDSFDVDTPLGTKRMKNVIATWHPEGGECAVDISAHLDSKYEPTYRFLGATDSAAPVGMMLAAAQAITPALRSHLAEVGDMPCLRMIFFDGEEAFKEWTATDSTYGSRHLAAAWARAPALYGEGASRLASMRCLALLDLLGTARPDITWQFAETRPLFARMQAVEARMRELNMIGSSVVGASGGSLLSNGSPAQIRGKISDDHLPFLDRGVPILHLIPSPFPSVWHTEGDNLEALDAPTVDALGVILTATLAEVYGLKLR